MKDISIFLVSIINLVILLRYLYLINQHKIRPSLAMWSFFSIAVGMSLLTYMTEGKYSLLDNVLNTTDFIMVLSVAVGVYFIGDKSARFNSFEKILLVLVALIILFWFVTRNHLASNILIQVILVIAYFPVIKRMLVSKQNTEPFSVWILLLLAPIISFISLKGDMAAIYAWRAIGCTSGLLLLMVRIEHNARKSRQKALVRDKLTEMNQTH